MPARRGFIADVIGNDTAALDGSRASTGAISPEWQVVADFLMMMTAYGAGLAGEVLAAAQRCAGGAGASCTAHDLILPGAHWLTGRPNAVPEPLPPLPPAEHATPNDLLWAGVVTALIEAGLGAVGTARVAQAVADRAGHGRAPVPAGDGRRLRRHRRRRRARRSRRGGPDRRALHVHAAASPGVDRGLRFVFVVAYVLAPEMRSRWEFAEFGPLHERRRTIAQHDDDRGA